MSDPLTWIDDELRAWNQLGLRRQLIVREGRQGAEITVGGRRFINFGSNDYLGLAGTSISDAAIDAIRQRGWGSGASPLVTGRGRLHAQLEESLAAFEGTEAALLFSSGFAANCGAITSLAGKGDVIFSDAKNHASIIDGCRLSGARVVVYPHRDMSYLTMMLKQAASFGRRLIASDGLFSMDGDLAPLPEIVELAQRHHAMVLVDEAHATGVFGARGRGAAEHWNVEELVHIRVGTLSKALGSIGGFVAGSARLIEWLSNKARSYVFSTILPEAAAAAAMRSLEIVRAEPDRRHVLLERAASLRNGLQQLGWTVGDCAGQIVPVYIGEAEQTMRLAAALQDRGLFVPGIRPPSVPNGESLLRVSVTHEHREPMLAELLAAFQDLRRLE